VARSPTIEQESSLTPILLQAGLGAWSGEKDRTVRF
jgi:hypothetical protein